MFRPFEPPQLEAQIVDDGTLDTVIDFYCEVCDSSTTHRYANADRVAGAPSAEWLDSVTEEAGDEHDCLLPLRQMAQTRDNPAIRVNGTLSQSIRLAQLACRALGEEYA